MKKISFLDTHDLRIKYYSIILEGSLENIKEIPLPAPYKFVFYKKGDMDAWINIEMSAKEISNKEQGIKVFNEYFGKFEDKLPNRMIFIEDQNGKKIATASAYFDPFFKDKSNDGYLHWVAIAKEYQGKGLAYPLITHTLNVMKGLGYTRCKITTQTNTWLACKLYLNLGFKPNKENVKENYKGYQILNTILDDENLKEFGKLDIEEIYNH